MLFASFDSNILASHASVSNAQIVRKAKVVIRPMEVAILSGKLREK